jgi:hypothetical protein
VSDFSIVGLRRNKASPGEGGDTVGDFIDHAWRLTGVESADSSKIDQDLYVGPETEWQPHNLLQLKKSHPQMFVPGYFLPKINDHLNRFGITKYRKDAVVCEEVLLTASAAIFRGGSDENPWDMPTVNRFFPDCVEFLKQQFGMHFKWAVYHLDEVTPHVSAAVIPIILKEVTTTGRAKHRITTEQYRLSADSKFDKEACGQVQTDFADFLIGRNYPVQRGVKRSKTPHLQRRIQVGFLSQPTPQIPSLSLPMPSQDLESMTEAKEVYFARVQTEVNRFCRKVAAVVKPLHAKALEYDQERYLKECYHRAAKRNELALETAEAELNRWRQPVGARELLSRLLGRKVVGDVVGLPTRNRLKFSDDDPTTFNVIDCGGHPDLTGAGSLGLIKAATGWSDEMAIKWLEVEFGPTAVATALRQHWDLRQSSTEEPPNFFQESCLPAEDTWPMVRERLTGTFKFSPRVLEPLHRNRILLSDRNCNLLVCAPATMPEQVLYANCLQLPAKFVAQSPQDQPLLTLGPETAPLLLVEDPVEALALFSFLEGLPPLRIVAIGLGATTPQIERVVRPCPDVPFVQAPACIEIEPAPRSVEGLSSPDPVTHSWLKAWIESSRDAELAEKWRRHLIGILALTFPEPGAGITAFVVMVRVKMLSHALWTCRQGIPACRMSARRTRSLVVQGRMVAVI